MACATPKRYNNHQTICSFFSYPIISYYILIFHNRRQYIGSYPHMIDQPKALKALRPGRTHFTGSWQCHPQFFSTDSRVWQVSIDLVLDISLDFIVSEHICRSFKSLDEFHRMIKWREYSEMVPDVKQAHPFDCSSMFFLS